MRTPTLEPNAPSRAVVYPDSDGKPMAETREHREAMTYAIAAAAACLSDRDDRWISGNDFVYFVEGDPTRRVSPDCYIVLGVPRRARRSYKVWEEGGVAPSVVIEFTSRKTARQDRDEKKALYEQTLRVPEYFLYDPLREWLRPPLLGFRLVEGAYQPIAADADGVLWSCETGIGLRPEGELLRFLHPATGAPVPTRDELVAQLQWQSDRALWERERAEAERERAEAERQRADALAAELTRLQKARGE